MNSTRAPGILTGGIGTALKSKKVIAAVKQVLSKLNIAKDKVEELVGVISKALVNHAKKSQTTLGSNGGGLLGDGLPKRNRPKNTGGNNKNTPPNRRNDDDKNGSDGNKAESTEGDSKKSAENPKVTDYRPSNPPFEKHHGILDVWAKNNIENYVSRGARTPTVELTKAQHDATKRVYRDWLFEKTGKRVGGKIDWTKITAKEIKDLAERMFDAAGVSQEVRQAYYRAFYQYIYRGN